MAAAFLGDFTRVLAADDLDEGRRKLWGDDQRGIGELMMEHSPDASSIVRGYAAFYCEYEEVFAPWMGRFADDLFSPEARTSHRLATAQCLWFPLRSGTRLARGTLSEAW